MAKKLSICGNLNENLRIIEGKPANYKVLDTKMNPRAACTVIEPGNETLIVLADGDQVHRYCQHYRHSGKGK
jgi:hypothetical protein